MNIAWGIITMIKKDLRTICLVVAACGLCIFLSACSDNKSQDTPSPSPQSAGSQSPTPATPPSTEQSLPAGGGDKCDALLTAKCTKCHSTSRICEKLSKKSKARWQRTISRMTERGAEVNVEEGATLLVCLDSGAKELLQTSCR